MSHVYHEGPDGAVLYDNCPECDSRAARPLDGLLNLDAQNYERLRLRMLSVEFGQGTEHVYLTSNEAQLGHALYLIAILEERHGAIFGREIPKPVWNEEAKAWEI